MDKTCGLSWKSLINNNPPQNTSIEQQLLVQFLQVTKVECALIKTLKAGVVHDIKTINIYPYCANVLV